MQVRSLGWEDILDEGMETVFLPGKFHGQSSLVGLQSMGSKKSDMTEYTGSAWNTLTSPDHLAVIVGVTLTCSFTTRSLPP